MSIAEWLRGHLFTGFPWNAFGYALTPTPLMMQSASLVGVWGLTLAAFFIFAAPVALVGDGHGSRKANRVVLGKRRRPARSPMSAFGALRLAGGPDALVPDVHLRIVQPAIPQDERWQFGKADETVQRYRRSLRRRQGRSRTCRHHRSDLAGIGLPVSAHRTPAGALRHRRSAAAWHDAVTGAARAERQPGEAPPP